ncbi:synaptopodin-2 isoform X2 [Corythoichthys intestinalis]|uniref:synaptopodin-2 isoform X2 n=1 Tax=Corythoichthys intestinalis TaxID=161448 RepID=UPI0025A603B0|nr:synaptopodin-2 isoform X2 [Corythoichthys intestinalis]
MRTGDYVCITLQGGGPWGFTLEEGPDTDTDAPLLVSKVEESGCASQAGVREGDRLVALNGEPCAGVALSQAQAIVDATSGCLRLLIKRRRGAKEPSKMRELYISESQDEVSDGDLHRDSSGETPSPSLSQITLDNMVASPHLTRKPLSQHGVVQGRAPAASASPGRGILSGGVGGPGVSAGSPGAGGGPCELPGSFSLSFQISSDDGTPVEEQDSDSDPEKPNKHRARHARLRRSESLSEKQVKEAKSKCKRIALLLSAAQPNPNNKGLLMFKKHRQRAKKYTLVSYGTGEDEREDSTEEDEEDSRKGIRVVEFTLEDRDESDLEKRFLANARGGKSVLTICLDKSLLDGERNQTRMECLPETKGKGALMFAQRRQRMDEIAAEHEELRRQGMPVEGAKAEPDQAYMDVNVHQQQQYQQYQEQQYYEQQQQQQQFQQQQQYQQYQQQYEQQQMHQQDQHLHFSGDGSVQPQSHEARSSLSNRTAKPFPVQNVAATPYSPAMSGTNQYSVGQGEQIASRDERISTPAIRSGILDLKRRNVAKPMFTFKETPKMSPNPELLNLVNMSNKKIGFESGPEEDYLSLGAEACNFLLSSRSKHKNPPPVAPKPVIDPSAAPWSPQMEVTNQGMPQHSENSASTPAVAPAAKTTLSNDREPTSTVHVSGPSPPQAQLEAPAHAAVQQQTWPPVSQQQVGIQEGNCNVRSSPLPETGTERIWDSVQVTPQQSTISCYPAQVQPHEPPLSQSSLQPQWTTPQPTHSQVQSQTAANTWTPQIQASWNQAEQAPSHAQPSWCQPQELPQSQTEPNWTHASEPQAQQIQPAWGRPQEPMLQQQVSWAQAPPVDSQPTWAQHESQAQAPCVQPEFQQQPSWGQIAEAKSWPQAQAPDQQWASAQPQAHPPIITWPPPPPTWTETAQAQPHVQPPAGLNAWAPVPAQPQPQPSWTQQPAEQVQGPSNSWEGEQGPPQHQATWVQSDRPQPQPSWQQAPLKTVQQPAMNAWSQAQTPPTTWTPQSQQTSGANTPPLPKPWNTQQKRGPQRVKAFTSGHNVSFPVNPLATVLNPSSSGSAYEMPAVRGKGADMFAKRQSRMEKYVVDSETVQANMAGRSTSPAASLPSEWKYTPNVRAPPSRGFNPIQSPSYPPGASKQPPSSAPESKAKKKGKQGPPPKPLDVVDVMKHQPYQLSASLFTYGPAAETAKESSPKPSCSPQNQQPVQSAGTFSTSYPEQPNDGNYQPSPNAYPQQPSGGPYWQPHNKQPPQLPSPQYPPPQVPYEAAASPPYLSPSLAFQQPTHANVAPSYPVASPPGSTTSGNAGAAPKPKFMAKKSSAQVAGRSYSLSPPGRAPSTGHQSPASSGRHPASRQTYCQEKAPKAITPWEAASRHPLGLVDEAFAFQELQQNLASSVRLAAQRKPPPQWTAGGSRQKTGGHWSWGPGRGGVASSGQRVGYGSLPRQWQPHRSATQFGPPSQGRRPPMGLQKSFYSTNYNWQQ